MIRKAVKGVLGRWPAARRAVRAWRAERGHPDWASLVRSDRALWDAARVQAKGGKRVLIATDVGGFLPGATVEGALAAALTLRGAEVEFLLCDGVLPACLEATTGLYRDPARFAEKGPQADLCASCFAPAEKAYSELGLRIHRFSQLVTPAERRQAAALAADVPAHAVDSFQLDGLPVGEHALAGALRFFARGTLEGEPQGEKVLRRYFEASLLTAYAARRLLAGGAYDAAVFHHGIYVPQGVVGAAARAAGVRVVNWNPAYRKRRFIFSHEDTYHHTLMTEPASVWEHMPWDAETEARTLEYLRSRWEGSQDWIWFHEEPKEDPRAIAAELGIDLTKPTIGLLTNVVWDAQLHYPANAFPGMLDWLRRTVAWFAGRPDLQLLIRVHPAELRGSIPSRQPVVEELKKAFGRLPANVFVAGPESRVSTYAAMLQCNAVLIYGTKTGVELSSLGIPVIVAGEAWIRNKGITRDAKTADEYFGMLDSLPLAPEDRKVDVARARRYAHHFFFRRMIPLEFMEPAAGFPPYRFAAAGLADLAPGRSAGLDVVCGGILDGTEFVYDEAPARAGALA